MFNPFKVKQMSTNHISLSLHDCMVGKRDYEDGRKEDNSSRKPSEFKAPSLEKFIFLLLSTFDLQDEREERKLKMDQSGKNFSQNDVLDFEQCLFVVLENFWTFF